MGSLPSRRIFAGWSSRRSRARARGPATCRLLHLLPLTRASAMRRAVNGSTYIHACAPARGSHRPGSPARPGPRR